MQGIGMKLASATMVALLLGACVPNAALVDAGLAEPPAPQLIPDVYAARADGTYTVPAVPVEKVPVQYQRQSVYFPTEEVPGTIIINPQARLLHLVTGKNQAIRYGISVGAAGFEWSGEAIVANRRPWPTWTPPPEMIDRKPELAKWEKGQPGGPTNPLGARALYLETNGRDYGYRIHGTPDWQSIGRNASSGCIRMINQDVMDLYERVPAGAKVIVMTRDGQMPSGLTLPPPAPKKPKPAVVAAAEPKEVVVPSGLGNLPMLSPMGAVAEPAETPAPEAPASPTAADDTPPAVTPTAPEAPDAPAPQAEGPVTTTPLLPVPATGASESL
ncbi:L,D-transpeptidase [Cereibacter changlensis]|uniref:L,D-transpeptidase n=1 Tax=Cereibacter changlensis TaxID=402884 RepID=UPI004033F260